MRSLPARVSRRVTVCTSPGGFMYKYTYRGEIHTARDFFEARNKAGLSLPRTFHSISHYVTRLWQWDETERDYAVEILNPPGHQIFNSYDEALVCYNTLAEFFPGEITHDVKLELVQFHLGEDYGLESQVLYPPVTAWEW